MGVMGQWFKRLPHNRKLAGSSLGRAVRKTLKISELDQIDQKAKLVIADWGRGVFGGHTLKLQHYLVATPISKFC